jgi:hypothetical protein
MEERRGQLGSISEISSNEYREVGHEGRYSKKRGMYPSFRERKDEIRERASVVCRKNLPNPDTRHSS